MTSTSDPRDLRTELETLTTEAFRPELAEIDQLPTLDIARLMNGEDATVAGRRRGPAAPDRRRDRRRRRADGPGRAAGLRGRGHRRPAGRAGRLRVPAHLQHRPLPGRRPDRGRPGRHGHLGRGRRGLPGAGRGPTWTPSRSTPDDTVVGISASGRTPYAIGAVEHARAPRRPHHRPGLQPGQRRWPQPPTTASRSSWAPSCSPARPA